MSARPLRRVLPQRPEHEALALVLADQAAALRAVATSLDALRALLAAGAWGQPSAPEPAVEPGPYLNLQGAAAVLGMHRNTVAAALQRGELRGVRVGSRWRIPAHGLTERRHG